MEEGNKFGPYVVLGELAVGGMATVYVGRHERLGHIVALKVIHRHYHRDSEFRDRFVDEARIMANIRHPHILSVQDILELPGTSGMVMELMAGCSLKEYYDAVGLPLPYPVVIGLFTTVAEALSHAHDHGVVHRDLKPSNIFLHCVQDLVIPKLTDFGVAKLQNYAVEHQLTTAGAALGTPQYMAPEQFEDSSSVDARSDIFAMGIMLFEAATGKRPFEGRSYAEIMANVLSREPCRPVDVRSDIPMSLADVIEKCLRRDRTLRYESTGDLVAALRELGKGIGVAQIPAGDVPKVTLPEMDVAEEGGTGEGALSGLPSGEGGSDEASTVAVPEAAELLARAARDDVDSLLRTTVAQAQVIPGYATVSTIHEGEETVLYRAVAVASHMPVVIKTPKNADGPKLALARLKHEFKVATELAGVDGAVGVHGLEKVRSGLALVMEDFGGTDLAALMTEGRLPLSEALATSRRLADTLAELHERDVVHGAVSPGNILVNRAADVVKLTDFGLSASGGAAVGQRIGGQGPSAEVAYMSPEQTGRMGRPVDFRTDLYSLGAVMFEMLTGHTAFDVEDPAELVRAHLCTRPRSPRVVEPGVPDMVCRIVLKLLEKYAEDRYQSGRGVMWDIDECLRQYETDRHIATFELGSGDVLDRFEIPPRLYGRDGEMDELFAAFKRTAGGYKELFLVAGYSGIGKTSVVAQLHRPVTERRGFFISGKFDQYKRDVPYGAVVEALSDLVVDLLGLSAEALDEWRGKLGKALGVNAAVMVDVIPDLAELLGEHPPPPELPPAESLNRLRLAFHHFMSVFSAEEHPMVLFLDDLQWADNASLAFIDSLVAGPEVLHLLLLGAFRDNEVGPAHPLAAMLDELHKAGAPVHKLHLEALPGDALNRMVADVLRRDVDDCWDLSQLLLARTGGNPFFLVEFLKSLHSRELLEFSDAEKRWEWSLDKIGTLGLPENVVDLMVGKIQRLDRATQQALQVAACIGSRFELQVLAAVTARGCEDVVKSLDAAIGQGLVVATSERQTSFSLEGEATGEDDADDAFLNGAVYRFAHDRIHQAAYSTLPEDVRRTVHGQVGRLLLHKLPPSMMALRIFDIVNQLNAGQDLAGDSDGRTELAGLNLRAGKKAKASGAYSSGYEFLQEGIRLVGERGWVDDHSLTRDLHVEAAEAAYLCTRFDEMEELATRVVDRAESLFEKVGAYEVLIGGRIAQAKKLDAIRIGLTVLGMLGMRFPEEPGMGRVMAALVRTKVAHASRGVEGLADLPDMTDQRALAAIRIAANLYSTAYVARPNLFAQLVLRMVELSARKGNAPQSAFTYALYGTICCGVLGHVDTGYRLGQMALKVLQRFEVDEFHPRTLFTVAATSQHFKEHLPQTYRVQSQAYKSALELGVFEFAGTSSGTHIYHLFFAGANLRQVEWQIGTYVEVMEQVKQAAYLNYLLIYQQAVFCLLGKADDPTVLKGDAYDGPARMPEHVEADDGHGLFNLHLLELVLGYLFGRHRSAAEGGESALEHVLSIASMYPSLVFRFYDSLACLALLDECGADERKGLLARVGRNQKQLKKWVRSAPENHRHKYLLVEAELARVLGRTQKAGELYEKAIDLAAAGGFVSEAAIGCEAAARFFLGTGQTRIARTYLDDALREYGVWGAVAKVNHLENEYSDLLRDPAPRGEGAGQQVDEELAGEAPAARTLLAGLEHVFSETKLEALLEQGVQLLVSRSGAESGLLILDTDGKFFVEAEFAPEMVTPEVLQHASVLGRNNIAQAVLNYVIRVKEPVVLKNAAEDAGFGRDTYISTGEPRSLLCMPLLSNRTLAGLLYLENRSEEGAFTRERMEFARAFSGRLLPALEAARHYSWLEAENRRLELEVHDKSRQLKEVSRDPGKPEGEPGD